MKKIRIEHWDRKEHFPFFQGRLRPQVEVTARLDISGAVAWRRGLAEQERPRLSDMLYFLAGRAANGIREFRTRIVDREPVEFSRVHLAFTYRPNGRGLHANCLAAYSEGFTETVRGISAARQEADQRPTLTPAGAGGQDLLYFSILPGLVFSSLSNPWGDPWTDSVPRIVFGKVLETASGAHEIPVSVEVLHSLMDGVHIERLLTDMAGLAASPQATFA